MIELSILILISPVESHRATLQYQKPKLIVIHFPPQIADCQTTTGGHNLPARLNDQALLMHFRCCDVRPGASPNNKSVLMVPGMHHHHQTIAISERSPAGKWTPPNFNRGGREEPVLTQLSARGSQGPFWDESVDTLLVASRRLKINHSEMNWVACVDFTCWRTTWKNSCVTSNKLSFLEAAPFQR